MQEPTTKTCSNCRKPKPLDEFYRNRDGVFGRQSRCKKCERIFARARYARDREKINAQVREYYQANRDHYVRYQRNYRLKTRLGMTQEEWDALLASQDHRCAICKTDSPPTWHTDHCHATGKIRGILCQRCNTGLGMFKDDPERLKAASEYLERHLVCPRV